MADEGVNFGEKLARDVKEVTERILAARGKETKQVFGRGGQRQTRFYKAPSGGIAAPSNSTTPSSATCTLMKWNSAGTAIEETNTTETVYSFSEYAANSIFQAKQVGGRIFADSFSETQIPATKIKIFPSNTGIFKRDITTTKSMAQVILVGAPTLWVDYWTNVIGGSTAGNLNILLAGAYIVNIEFKLSLLGTKSTQVELDVVGGSNIFVYTADTPSDVTIELWAVEKGNTTYPGTSGDGVKLDDWKNVEPQNGLAISNQVTSERSGILSAMFESQVDDFELQVWHYEANSTSGASNIFTNRTGGWILKLPNSIDDTFDAGDLGISESP